MRNLKKKQLMKTVKKKIKNSKQVNYAEISIEKIDKPVKHSYYYYT